MSPVLTLNPPPPVLLIIYFFRTVWPWIERSISYNKMSICYAILNEDWRTWPLKGAKREEEENEEEGCSKSYLNVGEGDRMIISLLEDSQVLPASPSGRSSMKTKECEEEVE
jgi:hypothetical protein